MRISLYALGVVLSLLSLIAGNTAVAGGPGARPDRARNLELVASHDLGGAGFNTDVWALGKYAYVGTWGVFGAICPAGGVKVIDISKPGLNTSLSASPVC